MRGRRAANEYSKFVLLLIIALLICEVHPGLSEIRNIEYTFVSDTCAREILDFFQAPILHGVSLKSVRKAGEKSAAFRLTLAATLSFGLAEGELIRRCRSFYSSYPSGERGSSPESPRSDAACMDDAGSCIPVRCRRFPPVHPSA